MGASHSATMNLSLQLPLLLYPYQSQTFRTSILTDAEIKEVATLIGDQHILFLKRGSNQEFNRQ
jgi:hypothetical protein